MKPQDYKISSDKLQFRAKGVELHDTKLETKPISYFRDALNRFTKNKASIVAAFIIAILIIFAIIGPWFTPYEVKYSDTTYAFVLPKNELFYDLHINFWDGCKNRTMNKVDVEMLKAIEEELNTKGDFEVLRSDVKEVETTTLTGKKKIMYKVRVNTYNVVGVKFEILNEEEFKLLQEYQNRTGIQVLYPVTDEALRPQAQQDNGNGNYWYQTEMVDGKTSLIYDQQGKLIPIYKQYKVDENGKYIVDDNYNSLRIDGDNGQYAYGILKQGGTYQVRVNYREYYTYKHTEVLQDGIEKPSFLFGTNQAGKDLFVCLASGARFSFLLAIIVASINLFVGAIYGAIEGYYGGTIDLVMERFCDILGSVPFMIVITLLKYHLQASHILILFISFFLTGWMGMAGRTRMQFYRFKNQEYVLVARTLGANDRRIMFKHIFPNAIGTLITSCVLVIPSVIFSETSLSYLGIINLETGSLTSVGTLLSQGQAQLYTYPHMIVFPSLFISFLMLSFNLFGNGLRDAFNPSLRGTEE